MELSEHTVAHIALDMMITANVLLSEVDSTQPVLALNKLREAIMEIMHQFELPPMEVS